VTGVAAGAGGAGGVVMGGAEGVEMGAGDVGLGALVLGGTVLEGVLAGALAELRELGAQPAMSATIPPAAAAIVRIFTGAPSSSRSR
jgi:hypothetical protein